MKITTFLFVCAALVFTGCSQFEEGPEFSLRSKTARLAGDWTSTEVTPAVEDPNYVPSTFEVNFTKDGDYTLVVSTEDPVTGETFVDTIQGEWSWDDNSNLTLTTLGGSFNWDVLRLSGTELWADDGFLRIVFNKD
jgi:hypothetical protein